ncbi:MAG: hypothetical protein MUE73_20185 [Planctomycetes bacterium]|jgi:tetratricopeptide (TPR) repeat protein|nr:hypothetical protein [Planctomycetota bacterium]
MRPGWPALAALLILAAAAAADTLYLKNGGTFEGKLVEKTATHYVFRIPGVGVQRIPLNDVLRVEEKDTAADEYERRRAALGAGDAEARYGLGLWCETQGLRREAREMFAEVLELAPDHAEARAKLGYAKYDGRWVEKREAERLREERDAARFDETDTFYRSYVLEKSRQLPGTPVWYWPPRSWRLEEFPGRPKVVHWGPVQSGVGYRTGLEILDVPVEAARKDIEAALLADGAYRVDDRARLDRPALKGAAMLPFRGGTEDRPVLSYHALLALGERTLHAEVLGPGFSTLFVEMVLSDLLTSLSHEAPPDLHDEPFDFRVPGPVWTTADAAVEAWTREKETAPEDRKQKLGFRFVTMTMMLMGDQLGYRHVCLKDGLGAITVGGRRRLGMSTLPLEEALERHLAEKPAMKPLGPVAERRVAGQRALLVNYARDASVSYWYCAFIKGDALYWVHAWNWDEGEESDRLFRSGLDRVLDSFRLP